MTDRFRDHHTAVILASLMMAFVLFFNLDDQLIVRAGIELCLLVSGLALVSVVLSDIGANVVYNKHNATSPGPDEIAGFILSFAALAWIIMVMIYASVTSHFFPTGSAFLYFLLFLALLVCPLPPPTSALEPLVFVVVACRGARGDVLREFPVHAEDEVQSESAK